MPDMTTAEDVKKLAALARLSIPASELDRFTKEFDAIVAYMGQLEALELPSHDASRPPLTNVMRSDEEPHEGGKYTEQIAAQFPSREGDALSVKQIVVHE